MDFMLFLLIVFFFVPSLSAQLSISTHAQASLLVDLGDGTLLYAKDPDGRYSPASLTKIATALYALNVASHRVHDVVTVDRDSVAWASEEAKRRSRYSYPAYWLENGCAHIGLRPGEQMTLLDLLYGMMLSSGDDAANAIAKYVGGTIPQFMEALNRYLVEIGCSATHFTNPHGLYHPDHYTTARDLAIIAREALRNPLFCEIVGTVRHKRSRTNLQEESFFVQTNRLLRPGSSCYYPYATGVKTGYIRVAKYNLVASAEREGRALLAVLLKTPTREESFEDAKRLFEAAFCEERVCRRLFASGKPLLFLHHDRLGDSLGVELAKEVTVTYYPSARPWLTCRLAWEDFVFPVRRGQKVGRLLLRSGDGCHDQEVALLASADVAEGWGSFFCRQWHTLCRLVACLYSWLFSE